MIVALIFSPHSLSTVCSSIPLFLGLEKHLKGDVFCSCSYFDLCYNTKRFTCSNVQWTHHCPQTVHCCSSSFQPLSQTLSFLYHRLLAFLKLCLKFSILGNRQLCWISGVNIFILPHTCQTWLHTETWSEVKVKVLQTRTTITKVHILRTNETRVKSFFWRSRRESGGRILTQLQLSLWNKLIHRICIRF